MLIGLDFDNTLVCYDRLFHRLAAERGLIPPTLPAGKRAVRDHLRACGREDDWTELQGLAYGPQITGAEPFPHAREFLTRCRAAGVAVAVVSHKTRWPYRGLPHDLHAAAFRFLAAHGFFRSDTGLSPDRVYLEPTLEGKLARVAALGCDVYIDDLPEVLTAAAFPAGVRRVLFDPGDEYPDASAYERVRSWAAAASRLLPLSEHAPCLR